MKQIKPEQPPQYSPDPWRISENSYSRRHHLLGETIFALGNGYLGMRGSFEEVSAGNGYKSIDGIYINGFFESVPIPHAEKGYGYPLNTQTMLNVTDSKIIELYLEDERFNLDQGTIIAFRRTLELKSGFMEREVTWRSPQGREVRVVIRRLVSFAHRHLIAIQYRIKPLNFTGPITISSSLNGAVDNHTHEEEDPRFSASLGGLGLSVTEITREDQLAVMIQETKRSQLTLACAMNNCLREGPVYAVNTGQNEEAVSVNYRFEAEKDREVVMEKYVSYYTSRDYPVPELPGLATAMVIRAKAIGFKALLEEQKAYLERFWERTGLVLDGDPALEQGLRFNLYHLLQSAGSDGKTGIGAKGLTSEGYDGHYFWDIEIYMIPFYAAIIPDEARKLLEYRYSILDHARHRARELAHPRGALYPWRTIAGEEGSSYYPAGTAQYHINAAIAYAVCKYLEMTADYSFMLDYGAEMVFETARLWEDLGAYIPRKGNLFCYNEVTGPDEYTALVNNNCYNNLMARWHLDYACKTAKIMQEDHPAHYRILAEKINLREEEIKAWRRAADNMYIPFDHILQILPQDDSFLDKEIWDFSATPPEKYPLLLHYHPLVIYRYQVCKQPDIILAHLLLGECFSLEQKRRDYNYYEAITTHDSSLSPSIFSIIASELGYSNDALRFFALAARIDLDNLLRDTHYGVHAANMAGSWLCLTYGFAGMRTFAGRLSFKPRLPGQWRRYCFRIIFQGSLLEVDVKSDGVTYRLLEGDSINFCHFDQSISLMTGENQTFSYARSGP